MVIREARRNAEAYYLCDHDARPHAARALLLEEIQVVARERFTMEERNETRNREVGSEGYRYVAAMPCQNDQQHAGQCAHE